METYTIFAVSILILKDQNILCEKSQDFNINDILNKDLMPVFFFNNMDKEDMIDSNYVHGILKKELGNDVMKWINGSFDAAFSTMNFHRKMMNEYLCRNFLAEEILSELEVDFPRKHDRHGRPFSLPTLTFNGNQGLSANKAYSKNAILADAGSSSYKDWLSKTATFEDIYQRYKNANNTTQDIGSVDTRIDGFDTKDFIVDDEYHGGDITGYAYNNPIPAPALSGKVGYDHQPAEHYQEHSRHGMGLADLFEISLTGLAFLSFGMFALQVIMCMTMHQNNQTIVMQSVIKHGDPNDDIMNIDEVRHRRQRSVPFPGSQTWIGLEALNEISRRVLISIEAIMVNTDDDGACLRKSICESNEFSRILNDQQKFWIPLWNVGVSWAGGGWDAQGARRALDALRAAALGLGGAGMGAGVRCSLAFPYCNYTDLRQARDELVRDEI